MLEGIRKSRSVARRLVITAAAGAVAVGTVAALTTSAHAAPVRTLWLSGRAIEPDVRSVLVSAGNCDGGGICETKQQPCVDVTPGQDANTGLSFGGDTGMNAASFIAYSQAGCPEDVEGDPYSLFATTWQSMPEELPTERWWIELSGL